MQTQCPHCDTRFRVTETQVNTADGFVRCSVCQEVFNAIEVAEHDDAQPSLLNQQDSQHELTADGIEPAAVSFDNPVTDKAHEDTITDASAYGNSSADTFTAVETVNFNTTSASDDSRKETFDFFDEDANESLSHVVPENLKDSYTSGSATLISSVLWGAGILVLSATLIAEYVWFNRDQLNQNPQIQAWSETLCQKFECSNISLRNPKKIELIARNVYSHPNEKNALMVNLTIKNHANYPQPYPVMQINFSDVRGGNVAARRFLPTEYLPAEIQQQDSPHTPLFEADTNMTFTLEIQDPGKQAMTYEFDFL